VTLNFPELALTERNRLALRWTPRSAPALLDAGCAWGYATRFFVGRVQHVAGIDVDADAIDVARARYPAIDFRVAPTESIPYRDEAFDVVVCLDVLEHVEDERRSLDELFRVLRPGGTLVLTTPHCGLFSFLDPANILRRVGRSDQPRHRHYSVNDLRALLDASNWQSRYQVLRTHRSGLLAYPLALWVVANPNCPAWLRRCLDAVIDADYFVPWGSAAYCVAIKVRKLRSGSYFEHPQSSPSQI
jgi:2-polyprenyl-3-methyl-5-hydroxy-6-metoxy-1,4-benzoquinol methylase